MGYIYLVTNLINNKKYVGQSLSLDINTRWQRHKKRDKFSLGRYILAAYNKHGIENFKYQLICVCFDSDCDKYEDEYIKKYNSLVPNGYNLKEGGNNSKHSPETLKLICEKLKGRVLRPPLTDEQRKRMSEIMRGEKNPNYGKKMSEEQKAKIIKSRKEKMEQRKDFGISFKNKMHSNSLNNLAIGVNAMKKKVSQYDLNGNLITHYESISAAARAIAGDLSIIGKICNGVRKDKTYKGFVWKFIE